MNEEWRPIPGWEDRYEISSTGRVASLPTRTWPRRNILKPVPHTRGGYLYVNLVRDNQQHHRKIHALVCEAFNGARPDSATIVRHIDGDILNNSPSNLAWGNTSENLLDAVRHGTHAGARKTHCKNGHPLSGDNLVINSTKGSRQCRVCQNASKARYAAKKRGSANV